MNTNGDRKKEVNFDFNYKMPSKTPAMKTKNLSRLNNIFGILTLLGFVALVPNNTLNHSNWLTLLQLIGCVSGAIMLSKEVVLENSGTKNWLIFLLSVVLCNIFSYNDQWYLNRLVFHSSLMLMFATSLGCFQTFIKKDKTHS